LAGFLRKIQKKTERVHLDRTAETTNGNGQIQVSGPIGIRGGKRFINQRRGKPAANDALGREGTGPRHVRGSKTGAERIGSARD